MEYRTPQEVAEKMMGINADSPGEWLDALKSCGFRLEQASEEASEDAEEKSEGDNKPEAKPSGSYPSGDAPSPPLHIARMKAAQKALRGSK